MVGWVLVIAGLLVFIIVARHTGYRGCPSLKYAKPFVQGHIIARGYTVTRGYSCTAVVQLPGI